MYAYYVFYCYPLVRLVSGNSDKEGILEVYYNGRWGTVCNTGWGDNNSEVVCAQLGYKLSKTTVEFGPGTGNIVLDNVICSKNATTLASCGHYGVGITVHCDHAKDVGVRCYSMCYFKYSL